MSPLEAYWPADYIYVITLLVVVWCLYRGHRQGHINLWDAVTVTDDSGKTRTDGRKLFEAGVFTVMTIGFAYLVVQDKLTEMYAAIYVGSFVAAGAARDWNRRRMRAIELQTTATKKAAK